ncbi:molecular chaperone [Pseudomonadota bacterium]
MSKDLKTNAEWSRARANVYGLLAKVFRSEPSPAFLEHLKSPEVVAILDSLGCTLWDDLSPSSEEQLGEDLALEYTKLFIGPGPRISPHESMHVEARYGEENELWSEETVKVKKFMEAAGVAVNDDFIGMPDHISAEFEFMEQLLCAEEQAWKAEKDELAFNILNIEERFYKEHLSQWVALFCDKVIETTEQAFYEQFCEMTKGFIAFEGETLNELLNSCGGCSKRLSA